jgi:Gpi18-like mannosyltransferase
MFLYLLAKELEDEKTAFRACLWGLAFPTAFYAGLLYTESLFLCLVTAFFYFSRKGFRIQAAVCAFLLSLTRPTGVLVACAVLGEETKKEDQRRIRAGWRTALDFIGGFVFYLCLMKLWTGDYFAGIHAQRFFVSHNEFVNFIKPWNWLMDNFIQNSYTWNGPSTSFLNRAMFVVVLIALPSLYRAVEKDLFIYTLVLGIVPALLSDLMSYIRYVDVLFPLFILAALKIKTGPMEKILLVGCFLAQAFFLIAHSLNYWVG